MLKIVEKIKDDDAFKEFQKKYNEECCYCYDKISEQLDILAHEIKAKFINLDEVKNEIKVLIMKTLTIKLPDEFVDNIIEVNAEKESKKKGRNKK